MPFVLFSSSFAAAASQTVKGLSFPVPIFCSLIILCFCNRTLLRQSSLGFFFQIEYLFLVQVAEMMTGWMAASPGGTPAAPRRAGQVRNSLVPALHPKKERKKSRSVSASDRIVIPDSHCPTPWNSRSREAVAEEPRAVAAQQDRPRRRRGHRHAGLQVSTVAVLRPGVHPRTRSIDSFRERDVLLLLLLLLLLLCRAVRVGSSLRHGM